MPKSVLTPYPKDTKDQQDLPAPKSTQLPHGPQLSPVLSTEQDMPAAAVQHYAMDDVGSLRTSIFDKVKNSVASRFPMENTRYRFELGTIRYDSDKPYSKKDQKDALLKQTSINRRLKGKWRMIDKETEALVDEQDMVLAHVPYLTERGTFIKNGNEYGVANQSRLKAGAYNRRRNNGEPETHFNVLEGGRGFHLVMDPETKRFTMQVGGAKLKLFPILRELGYSDRQLRDTWGKEIYEDNISTDDSAKRARKQFGKHAEEGASLTDIFANMKLDPEVTSHTLGKPYANVTPDVILDSTKRLIGISNGTESEDDRDSIAYQKIMSPDDLFSERIALDYDKHTRQMLWRSTNKGRLSIDSGHFTKQLDTIFTRSGLAQALEETNPIENLDQMFKVLRTGEAGISSDGVPMESRNVQGSHLGIIDPVRGPECYSSDTEVFTIDGWVPWPSATYGTEFACIVDGSLEFHKPHNVIHDAYEGLMYGVRTKYLDQLVTPNHRVWCKHVHGQNETYRFDYAEDVHWKNRKFMCGGHGPYIGGSGDYFQLPELDKGSNSQKEFEPIPMHLWAGFMGWYLSEGSTHSYGPTSHYSVRITQTKEPQKTWLADLLSKLPFAHSYNDRSFTLCGKQLVVYLAQFGHSYDKYIPDYLLHADVASRRELFNTLLDGDGRAEGRKQDFRVVSKQLALDFQFLAISLGYSTNFGFEPDEREEQYHGCWRVSVHKQNERVADGREEKSPHQHYTADYVGTVHCATVPGGLLYVRRGNGIGTWSGNSGNVGLDSRFAINTRRGNDGRIYTMMSDAKGKQIPVAAQKAATSTIAFPGELGSTSKRVRAMTPGGKIKYMDREGVDFWMKDSSHMFSVGSNLVPMISSTLGPRLLMGGKFYNQALPVENPEAPLVQSLTDDGKTSFEQLYGTKAGAVRAEADGRIVKITDDEIQVKTRDGIKKIEMYNNFPFNRKTFLHNTPQVSVGDRVKVGDLLASSNVTDKKGTLALGKNLSVAYMPWKGLNTDDAVVISESAAKSMSSEHMFSKKIDSEDATQRDRKGFIGIYPGKYTKDQLANIGEDGLIRPGMVVQKGDPLILAIKERRVSDIHRGHKPGLIDASKEWDHEAPGFITDVEQTKKGVRLSIKAFQPMQVGDKLVGRFGDKGIISDIVRDGEMPTHKDGSVIDVILNPMGVVTRTNPSQLIELALGKIAAVTGKPFKIPGFMKGSMVEYALEELKKAGLSDTDTLADPTSKRKFKDIMTGKRFFMKLHHMSEDKEDARNYGGYTAEDQPVRGGGGGAKQMGMLGINALLSHGATEVIKDAKTIRGQKNNDFWKAFQKGYAPPSPDVPMIYKKFRAHMVGAGINLKKVGHQENIMALTDKDVLALSAGEITLPKGVDIDDMKEINGGIFDKRLTGGHGGNRWTHIKLKEPMPNPVMEEPARRLLGLTQAQFEEVLSGRREVYERTGGSAILEGLKRVDLKAMKLMQQETIRSGAKSKRDNAIKLLRYIEGLEKTGTKPEDMVMTHVPVLPPSFRPISSTEKFTIVADANKLYVDLMKSNEALEEVKTELGSDQAGDERLNLYNSFKAVTGLGDPISPRLKQQRVRGLLGHVFGAGSPKYGMFQRRVLGGSVDFSGRGVISPNPALDMDTVGLPEEQAWELYKPMVMRRMTLRGTPATVAAKNILDRTDVARTALVEEMESRPVIINRAPTLHKYNTMAVFPQLVKGHTLQVSPIIASGFNADYDGDAMQIHVPVSKKAVSEAKEKMLPSQNLLSASRFKAHYLPNQEFQHGLWLASAKQSKREAEVFATIEDAMAAYKNGELDIADKIRIAGIPVKKRKEY